MDGLTAEILKELRRVQGGSIDLVNHHYFLFFKDGVMDIYRDKDEKEIKIEIQFSDGIEIYHSDKSVEDLLKKDS